MWNCDIIMRNFIKKRIEIGQYTISDPKGFTYLSTNGWKDYLIHEHLIFSHRTNNYTTATFEKGLHNHDYYEAIVYIAGYVEFICENEVSVPKPGMVFCCPPEKMHTTRMLSESVYERYTFYFDRDFFTYCGEEFPLPRFISNSKNQHTLQPDEALFAKLRTLLASAEEAASRNDVAGRVLAYSYIIQFFSLLDSSADIGSNTKLPENVARIKKYIDTYYSSIEGVSEIAAHFFYSREHASRLFKQYFNITLSDYLMQRRVAESTRLLIEGSSVADACYEVGFRSVSSYINAFRKVTGCLPSEYKKKKQ